MRGIRMQISKTIIDHGTRAVLRYRAVAGLSQDNEVPEIFLGGAIACGLHDELNMSAHVERLYTTIAKELGVELSDSLKKEIDSCRADVAVYQEKLPVAVVELKIFDECTGIGRVVEDRIKMERLTRLRNLDIYLAILVTDTATKDYQSRISELQEALGQEFDAVGEKARSLDNKWNWCFVSTKLLSR